MSLGGNGFDFLLDPYRFGGRPVSATSVPYPVEADTELDGVVEGAFDFEIMQALEDFEASSRALSGEIRSILLVIDPDREDLDSITASALSGTIAQILKTVNADNEELDSISAVALSGSLNRILIITAVDEGDLDAMNSVAARATGGTIS